MGKPDTTYKKLRRIELEKFGKCSFCSPHDGENRGRRPRQDKYKSKRKGRC